MNVLHRERQEQILNALVEGVSIRSTERMTHTHRDTIMRLLVDVGYQCQDVLDRQLSTFHSRLIEVDEIWTFVRKKQARLDDIERLDSSIGDQYAFVALDAETKLVPTFKLGKRDGQTTLEFMADLYRRLSQNGRIQLTSDGFAAYREAVEATFGADIDFAQLIKVYAQVDPGTGRYSPPRVTETVTTVIQGAPDPAFISTSYVERQNLTMRMQMRPFTRLTNAFSKKWDNLKAALALHFAHYDFMRVHSSLRVTPAMEARITDHIWTWEDLLAHG